MKNTKIMHNKVNNIVKIFLVVSGMIMLLILIMNAVKGIDGIVWIALYGIILHVVNLRVSSQLILKLSGAKPLTHNEDVNRLIKQLSLRAHLPTAPTPYLVPSKMMNAFSAGSRDNAFIGLSDELLRRLTIDELRGVLAHEISHIKNNDMQTMGWVTLISRLTIMLSIVSQVFLIFNFQFVMLNIIEVSRSAIILLIAAPALTTLMQSAISRVREFDADFEAVCLTHDPEALAHALQKIDFHKRSAFGRFFQPNPGSADSSLLSTHPKMNKRIERLAEFAKELPLVCKEERSSSRHHTDRWCLGDGC